MLLVSIMDVYQIYITSCGAKNMGFLQSLFGSAVPEIKPVDLNERLKTAVKPFILDVRQPAEFQSGHIHGAKMIPLGELKSRLAELPKQKEIVCVCATGSRSSSASRILSSGGYQVINMHGGMNAWQRLNLPVKKGLSS